MSSLLHHFQGSCRASMPTVPTDEVAAACATFRRSRSDPDQRRRPVHSWLRKVLPASSSRNSRSNTEPKAPPAPTSAAGPRSLRRRKRDLMRSAFVRVFVKHRASSSHGQDASSQQSTDAEWLAPVAPWEDEASLASIADESACDRPSYGFPPFLKDEDPVGDDGTDDSDRSEDGGESETAWVREFVVPPVQIPAAYRRQDRSGGTMVAGDLVLFTRLAFKRRLVLQRRKMTPIPENCRFDAVRFATVCNYGGPPLCVATV